MGGYLTGPRYRETGYKKQEIGHLNIMLLVGGSDIIIPSAIVRLPRYVSQLAPRMKEYFLKLLCSHIDLAVVEKPLLEVD